MLVNLNDVLYDAQKNHYAVGLFNTIDTDMLDAVISAAEELRSPVIIGTAEVLLPFGELKLMAPAMISAAKRATVPVVVHFDHGLTYERCVEALQLGFSSIMYDGSSGSEEENVKNTREIVKLAHAMGATVEGEIGHVGLADCGDNEENSMYTTPQEAVNFVKETGVDALAIAIGTAHGTYKSKPKLDLERLTEIRSALNIPLVLHGGSGLTDEDFKNTIKGGIAKINIYTDMCTAGAMAAQESIKIGEHYQFMRSRKVDRIKEEVKKKMILFDSANKGF